MKFENEPITDDEWLLRRVRVEGFRTAKTPLISPNAFEPRIAGRDPDIDGISLYRVDCLDDARDVLATVDPDRRNEYGIVRIQVSFFRSLDCTVQSRPTEPIKGHVVVPELNATDYKADKIKFTAIKVRLATEASEDKNILLWPRINIDHKLI